jgi:hypothetical protein
LRDCKGFSANTGLQCAQALLVVGRLLGGDIGIQAFDLLFGLVAADVFEALKADDLFDLFGGLGDRVRRVDIDRTGQVA